ncbi:hypothetical protein [uncultured Shewanella sp.]|uniref:hypothetical protein n=1 Tax=uncultured Shewanella sp. TaxID=173975 RepID=UPI0026209148|nr:hypothetical protein [uncultured Shewanella sp.]
MFKFNCHQFTHTIEKVNTYCHQHHWCLSQWCVSKHRLTYGNDAFTELFHLPKDLVANEPLEAEKHNDKDSDEEGVNGGSLH